jgi:hypothetical protein
MTMFEDYLAGGLLLIAGWASVRARPWSAVFLVLAWACVTSMMNSSFWYQVEETLRGASAEPHNLLVVVVKGLLWATCLVSLVLSFRQALRRQAGSRTEA